MRHRTHTRIAIKLASVLLLQAEIVDRGLMLTLDDVLFAGSSARLNAAGAERLDLLTSFLEQDDESVVSTLSIYVWDLFEGRSPRGIH